MLIEAGLFVLQGTVQLTTFRPLVSTPTSTLTAAANRIESSDTSDYENLSSCMSGRYATLPAQLSHSGVDAHDAEFSLRSSRPLSTSHGPPSNGTYIPPPLSAPLGPTVGAFGGFTAGLGAAGDGAAGEGAAGAHHRNPQATLSLHRPGKRSHWMNHNGRPSDVLARVLQNNSERNDDADEANAGDPPQRTTFRR